MTFTTHTTTTIPAPYTRPGSRRRGSVTAASLARPAPPGAAHGPVPPPGPPPPPLCRGVGTHGPRCRTARICSEKRRAARSPVPSPEFRISPGPRPPRRPPWARRAAGRSAIRWGRRRRRCSSGRPPARTCGTARAAVSEAGRPDSSSPAGRYRELHPARPRFSPRSPPGRAPSAPPQPCHGDRHLAVNREPRYRPARGHVRSGQAVLRSRGDSRGMDGRGKGSGRRDPGEAVVG